MPATTGCRHAATCQSAARLRVVPIATVTDREQARSAPLFAFSNEIVTSHMVIFSLGVTNPDPLYEGRLPEAFCRRGAGAAPASDGRRNLVPGPYSGSLVGH